MAALTDAQKKAMVEALEASSRALEGAKVLTQGPSYETADAAMVKIFNSLAAIRQALALAKKAGV